MAQVDVNAAMNAGYSLTDIAEGMAKENNVDIAAARAAGYQDWDIIQGMNKPTPGLLETFTGGVKRGIGELGILATDTLPALAAAAVLPEQLESEYVQRQFKEAQEARDELEAKYPTQYKSYKDVEDIRSGIGYVFERTGELVPDIIPSLISGGVGYQVGKKVATTAAEKTAVGVGERAAVRAGEKATTEALESGAMASEIMGMADEVGQRAAIDASKRFMDRSGRLIQDKGIAGAKYGTFFGSYAQNAPEIFENIYEETGEIAPAGALLFGGLSSYLDSFLPNQILDNLGTYGKSQLVSKMLKDSKAAPAVWKSVLKEAAKAAPTEGLTEAGQEAISVAAEKFYGSNKDFFGPENVDRYLESFFAGAAGGGVLGGMSGVTRGLREKAAARDEAALKTLGAEAGTVEEGLDPELAAQLKGAQGVDTEPAGGGVGEGVTTSGGPEAGAGTPGTTPSDQSGLDINVPSVAGTEAGAVRVDPAVAAQIAEQQRKFLESDPEAIELAALDSDIKSKRDQLRALREQNAGLVEGTYTTPEAILEQIQNGELAIDPAPFEQEAALAAEVGGLEQDFSTRQDKLFAKGREQGFFTLPTQIEGGITETTETGEAVPTGPTQRFVAREDGTFGPEVIEGPAPTYVIDQETGRVVKLDENRQPVKIGTKEQKAARESIEEAYDPEREAFDLPKFINLPKDQRQVFLKSLALGFTPATAARQLAAYRADKAGYVAEFGPITQVDAKPAPVKRIAEQQKKERTQLAETEKRSQQRAVEEARVERSIEQQPVGKGQEVDRSVLDALLAGDVTAALRALAGTARDLRTMKGSDRVVRTLASALASLNLKTKVVFGGDLASDRLAEYDPVTDTIYIQKGVVLDEATLLHELTHAATVKVLNAFENFAMTGERGDLTDAQIEAAEHLMQLMEVARKRITLDQYQNAFENIYEFVAYAMTDPRFQTELAKHNVRAIAKYTKDGGKQDLWSAITTAIERLVNFFSSKFSPTGNVALEVSEAFQEILAAPDQPIRMPTLPAKREKQTKSASVGKKEQTAEQLEEDLASKLEQKRPGIPEYRRAIEKTLTSSGMTNFVRKMQNERIWVKKFQDFLDSTGQLISSVPDKFNNLYTQITLSSGKAKNIFQKYFYRDFHKANQLLADMAKTYGMPVEKMLARLHVYALALHSPERRRIKFLREAPLTDDNAKARREAIFKELAGTKELTRDEALALRAELDALVDQYVDTSPDKPSGVETNSKYDTLAHTAKEEKLYLDQYEKDMKDPAKKALVQDYFSTLDRIKNNTIERNKEANYFSPQVGNFVNFYDFKNYFSFKGKPDAQASDYQVDPMSRALSGENQDKAYAFEGRLSESDNPMLNTLNEGARAALREGRTGVTQALSNLSKDPKFKNIAEVIKTVPFAERYEAGKDLFKDIPTQNTVFHYKPDGSIDIIQIADKEIREGVRRPFRDDHPLLDLANRATSFFGQMHTRYNPAFAPIDFTRNLLTYAGIVAAEYGPAKGANVIAQMASVIADGGMQKTAKFSLAFARGDAETMDRLAKEDPDFYGEMARYFELGGRVSYVQALSYRDNLMEAVQGAKRNPILRNKEQVDKFFDAWLDMFELTTRMAAFRTVKKEMMAQGRSEADAEVEAVAFAKNLANFEQVGEWGKTMGAFFMFFRPAATGAVRALQSIAPAFDVRSDEKVLESIKQQAKFGGATDEQAQRALAAYNQHRKNARVSAVAIAGLGAFTFAMAAMMAGDDEEERNKVISDDPARWVRNARFNTGIKIGGQDLVIQIPWGFGNGALASAGAQIAFAAAGGQGFMDMANNIMDATFESFLPLPVSKINKFENPTAWAVDSITPSVLRPLFEFTMNMDGLGRSIYNDRQSRYADAYTGGDNIPQMFKDAAAFMFETTGVDVSPNSIYFFANNYLDGVSRVTATTWGLGNVMIGRKDFDPRTDTFLLDAYLKSPSNYDSRMFSKAEQRIKDMEKEYKGFEGTSAMAQYINDNPMNKSVIDFYNSYVNGGLRDLRAAANRIRKDQSMSPAEKKQQLRLLTEQQNRVKSAFTTALAGFDEDFGDLVYER